MNEISLAIVEDNKRYAESIKKILKVSSQYSRVDIYSSLNEFKNQKSINYDIILLDINLPDGSGIDIIKYIKNNSPDTEIIMLTTFCDEESLFNALKLGASGYITKGNSGRYIREGIQEVIRGGAVISPDMAGRFLNYFSANKRENQNMKTSINLTEEEIEVIEILARGLTNREISDVLKIKYRYVKTILSKIYSKFNTSSRSEVVRRAVEMGIIEI